MSRMESLTKENLVRAKSAPPVAVSRTSAPSVSRIGFLLFWILFSQNQMKNHQSLCRKRGNAKRGKVTFFDFGHFWEPFCHLFLTVLVTFCLSPFASPPLRQGESDVGVGGRIGIPSFGLVAIHPRERKGEDNSENPARSQTCVPKPIHSLEDLEGPWLSNHCPSVLHD